MAEINFSSTLGDWSKSARDMAAVLFAILCEVAVLVTSFDRWPYNPMQARSLRDYASGGDQFSPFANFGPGRGHKSVRDEEGHQPNLVKTVVVTKQVPYPFAIETEKKVLHYVKVPVEKPYPMYVPKPYIVAVAKPIHYPIRVSVPQPYTVEKVIPVPVNVAVEKEVPVYVQKPYPVYKEKLVGYPVENPVPYPVKVPYDRPVAVRIPVERKVPYPVEKVVPYPVYVPEDRYVPVPVEKPYPVQHETPQPYSVEKPVPYPLMVPFQLPVEIPVPVQVFKPEPLFTPLHKPEDPAEQVDIQNEQQQAASEPENNLTSVSISATNDEGEDISELSVSDGSDALIPEPSSHTPTTTNSDVSPASDSQLEGSAPILQVQEYISENRNTTESFTMENLTTPSSTLQSLTDVSQGT